MQVGVGVVLVPVLPQRRAVCGEGRSRTHQGHTSTGPPGVLPVCARPPECVLSASVRAGWRAGVGVPCAPRFRAHVPTDKAHLIATCARSESHTPRFRHLVHSHAPPHTHMYARARAFSTNVPLPPPAPSFEQHAEGLLPLRPLHSLLPHTLQVLNTPARLTAHAPAPLPAVSLGGMRHQLRHPLQQVRAWGIVPPAAQVCAYEIGIAAVRGLAPPWQWAAALMATYAPYVKGPCVGRALVLRVPLCKAVPEACQRPVPNGWGGGDWPAPKAQGS